MRRAGTLALAVGVPALCSLLAGLGIRSYVAASIPPLPATVTEAVLARADIRMIELIISGADPHTPVARRLEGIARDRPIPVTPLMLAVETDNDDLVFLLTSLEIPWSEDERHDAYCVAVIRSRFEDVLARPEFNPSTCQDRLDRIGDRP